MSYPYAAFLFDLDGVLTSTASLHAARRTGAPREPFDEHDHLAHADGKQRCRVGDLGDLLP